MVALSSTAAGGRRRESEKAPRSKSTESNRAAVDFGHRKSKLRSSARQNISGLYPTYSSIIFRGVAQFGSFELDRCRGQKKGERKGAAVEIDRE